MGLLLGSVGRNEEERLNESFTLENIEPTTPHRTFMKKYAIPLVGSALVVGAISATGWAASLLSAFGEPTTKLLTAELTETSQPGLVCHKPGSAKLIAAPQLVAANETAGVTRVAINSVDDLAGDYVQTYSSFISSDYPGGCGATVSISNGNEISITNFYTSALSTPIVLKGTVDFEAKTVSFPSQYAFNNTTAGDAWVATCKSDATPDYDTPITGTIASDGTITLSSWWGVFVKEGDYAGQYFELAYNTKYERANAKMSYVLNDATTEFPVLATETTGNVLIVKNFFNNGQTFKVLLNGDRTATIPSQAAFYSSAGAWMTVGNAKMVNGMLGYSSNITTAAAAESDNRTITWSSWTAITSSQYIGIIGETSIVTDFDLTYSASTDFEGEGTVASPYLIKNIDDLNRLATNVNSDTNYLWPIVGTQSPYARVYSGRYFRLENDLDFADATVATIGSSTAQRFDGVFDGNGHKISNLKINTTTGYSGLFGIVEESSVIKNLTFESPNIESTGDYIGVVAAVSKGSIENVTVNTPTILSSGEATAAIAGVAYNVSDCKVVDGTIYALGGFGGGIAGEVDGTISNCAVEGTAIQTNGASTNMPTGGVVGSLNKGTADNCYFTGVIDGASNKVAATVGGVVGASVLGSITNCFAVGVINGYDKTSVQGGVAGAIYGTSIENSYFVGKVADASSSYTGGIVGRVSSNTTSASKTASIKNSYCAATVTALTYQYDRENEAREVLGTVDEGVNINTENVYFDKQITDLNSTRFSATTAELTAAAGPQGFDATAWVYAAGQYPRLKATAETEAAYVGASSIQFGDGNNLQKIQGDVELKPLGNTKYYFLNDGNLSTEGHFASIVDNAKIKIGDTAGTDTLYVVNGRVQLPYEVIISPSLWSGAGTAESPYLLSTKDDLIKLANATAVSGVYFPDTYFKITNDIDFAGDTSFTGICINPDDVDAKFLGVIDGDGHTIHNLNYSSIVWEIEPTETELGKVLTSDKTVDGVVIAASKKTKGFIGRLGEAGVVKNLSFAADCNFEIFAYSAAFVGENYGTVENCRNYANVTSYSSCTGAIVGENKKDAVVRNCYNAGDVTTGSNSVGGIIGLNRGIVENCLNVGDVTIEHISQNSTATATTYYRAGGIVGESSGGTYTNVENFGNIYARTKLAGGIAGTLPLISDNTATTVSGRNDIVGAINVGMIKSGDAAFTGAIVGAGGITATATSSTGTLKNIYYDAQILTCGALAAADKDGMTGTTTAELTSGEALNGLDAEVWQFDAGKYPVLKQFANEEKVVRARSVVLTIPAGNNVNDLKVDATLAQADGLTWALAKGEYFSIADNTLKAPASVPDVVADTITATYGDYVKAIVINAMPGNPLEGAGTEANPYLVKSTSDWNALADYMNNVKVSFEGEYIKLANDIDFTDVTFKPCADGTVTFKGTFDGDGHTISGINYTATGAYKGVFGTIDATATVKNLTLAGTITSASTYIAGFAGKLYGTLDNCVNNINVTATANYSAGFAAAAYGSARFINCVNKGKISSSKTYVAGIVAYNNVKGIELENCVNEGEIECTGTTANAYVAGIAATIYPATFTNCCNKGKITIKNSTTLQYVAGLVAQANGLASTAGYPFTFKGCWNESDIAAKAYIGGIVATCFKTAGCAVMNFTDCYNLGNISGVGTAAVSSSAVAGICAMYSPGSTFYNCYNEGNISSLKSLNVGGVVGLYANTITAAYPVIVKNCYNKGNITASANQGGGIAGYILNYTTVDSCWNVGAVSGSTIIGGLVGNVSGTATVTNSWNVGSVTASGANVGGLFGTANAANATINNCWNAGDVTNSSTTAAGTGGLAGASSATFVNCMNFGTVTGQATVGGLVGTSAVKNTKFTSCYNAGKVVAPADACGSIVGVDTNDTSKWSEADGNTTTDTYYISDNGAAEITNNAAGTAITTAELAQKNFGEGWTSADNYSLPVQSVFANDDAANLYAAQVVALGSDTPSKITGAFKVGNPAGIVWTADQADLIAVAGNDVTFTKAYTGDVALTATLGDFTKTVTVAVSVGTSGIDSINDADNIVETIYYTVAGQQVARPQVADGKVYVAIVKYADGTVKAVKILNK